MGWLLALGLLGPLGGWAPGPRAAHATIGSGLFPPPVSIAPASPRAGEGPIQVYLSGAGFPTIDPPVVSGQTIAITGTVVYVGPVPPFLKQVTLPVLAEGSYTLDVNLKNGFMGALQFTVGPPRQELSLRDERFRVTLARTGGLLGGAVTANAVKLTDESGYFWFFDGDNIEVTVKIVDGRAVNGRFWVFAASMTDLPFTLQIQDLAAACPSAQSASASGGCVRVYTVPGDNQNVIDVGAFGP